MTINPAAGIVGSAAGAPLSQSKESQPQQAADTAGQQRVADAELAAESAAGIGQTDEDAETSDRDGDGRRLWERDAGSKDNDADESRPARKSKDATGASGNQLDLSG